MRMFPYEKKCFQYRLLESFRVHTRNTAIESGEEVISYRELDNRSAAISSYLRKRGMEKGTFIGLHMGNRLHFIIVMIGILRAGCVFVPLDTALPPRRLLHMIRLTSTRHIFFEKPNYRLLLEGWKEDDDITIDPEKEILSFFWEDIPAQPNQSLSQPVDDVSYQQEDRIYIYFTSGTSGTPKAVVGKNKSLLHFIDWEIDTFGIDSTIRVTQFFAAGFDALLRDVFVPLCVGGTVCIPPKREIILESTELSRWIEKNQIHLIHCVPSLFRLLNMHKLTADHFLHLKYILLSGEVIYPNELRNWYNTFGKRIQLVNLYGPTETTMTKTFYLIQADDVEKEMIPVGKPMRGTQIVIFDKDMNLCSGRMTGEIYIRTPYATLGYYGNPQLDRERFIKNPFSDNPGDLLYKTGDLGRFLPDGNLELLGRIDRQVKIRGIRMQLTEIENTLLSMGVFSEVVVTAKQGVTGHNFLCAYLISADEVDTYRIREYLLKELPEYMVPSVFIRLEKIPRTANGKVDWKKLPEPEANFNTGNGYAPPGNYVELILARIWTDILEIDRKIGANDNFFRLGGHSLNTMALLSAIYQTFDVKIPLSILLKNATIRSLAQYIRNARDEIKHEDLMLLNKPGKKKIFCFPPAQGLGFVYKTFADLIENYSLYAFDFIKDEDRMKQYVQLIRGVQADGPYILFGWSAGGMIAFEVTKELEMQGQHVADIIFLDSGKSTKKHVFAQKQWEEMMEKEKKWLEEIMENMGLGFYKELYVEKMLSCEDYLRNLVNIGVVNANIHFIASEEKRALEETALSWNGATTKSIKTYQGFGKHVHMVNPGFVEKNANLVEEIVSRLL